MRLPKTSILSVYIVGIGVYLDEVLGIEMPPNKVMYCSLQMYTYTSAYLTSAYLLVTMTLERSYSIIRPHKAAAFNTVKRARVVILIIFLSFFTYSVPYLFIGDHNGIACIINKYVSINILGDIFHWLNETLVFVIPFSSLLIMNSIIIYTLKKRSTQSLSESTVQGQTEGQGQKGQKSRSTETQIIKMLLVITFMFLILNIPVRILVFYVNYSSGNTPYYYAGLNLFYQIGEKAFYTNFGINFFLYVISGQKFRTDLKNLFLSKQLKQSSQNMQSISS